MVNLVLVYLLLDDASYYTLGIHFQTWLGGIKFKLLYHYKKDFILHQLPRNFNLVQTLNLYGQVSIQINIPQLFA